MPSTSSVTRATARGPLSAASSRFCCSVLAAACSSAVNLFCALLEMAKSWRRSSLLRSASAGLVPLASSASRAARVWVTTVVKSGAFMAESAAAESVMLVALELPEVRARRCWSCYRSRPGRASCSSSGCRSSKKWWSCRPRLLPRRCNRHAGFSRGISRRRAPQGRASFAGRQDRHRPKSEKASLEGMSEAFGSSAEADDQ